ncbi:MAG: magnesium/cobalt transporter CorA [Candidatus Thorarchaeota archaeon]|nr:MAG: magnesium/cobalt transporter CorA [Candidatus Thorarchaeota archaeon]
MNDRKESSRISFTSSDALDKTKETPARLTLIDFSSTEMTVQENISIQDCTRPTDPSTIRWVHVKGSQDRTSVEQIGKQFGIHTLLVEDILDTKHRPKMVTQSDHVCLILRDIRLGEHQQIESEQVSIIIGAGFVLSFQESSMAIFDHIKDRISNPRGRIRNSRSDFLGYSLIDTIVDRYVAVMDELADQVEALEDAIAYLDKSTPSSIYNVRHMIGMIQRNARPLRNAISRLPKDESGVVEVASIPYLRDLYDNLLQVGEMTETYKETLSSMLEIHLLSLDRKTNETVRILTVVSTVLLPLTFLASLFGMNFQNMPFDWEYGYPVVAGLMFMIGLALVLYFRRKRWF